jgi:catechol 2,3-dioxygenase-like lactoylglutathione lyase family enzyme
MGLPFDFWVPSPSPRVSMLFVPFLALRLAAVVLYMFTTGFCKGAHMDRAEFGSTPKGGWSRMVCELHVTDLAASLAFWRDLIGFEIAYQRPAERFVYFEHEAGQQLMLCQRNGRFETGSMEQPLGQGMMMQLYLDSIAAPLAAVQAKGWPIYLGPREIWRRTGEVESGQREFFVQDPDGYLIMVAANIGTRPPAKP